MSPRIAISTTGYPVKTGVATEIQVGSLRHLLQAAESLAEQPYRLVAIYPFGQPRKAVYDVLDSLEKSLCSAKVLVVCRHGAQAIVPDFLQPHQRLRRPNGHIDVMVHVDRDLAWEPPTNLSLDIHPTTGRFSRWAIQQGLVPIVLRRITSVQKCKDLYNLLTAEAAL